MSLGLIAAAAFALQAAEAQVASVREAWARGDLGAVGAEAAAAFSAVEANGCAVSADGAEMAYAAGVAAAFDLAEGPPKEYWFWVASQINRQTKSLDRSRRAIARDHAGVPGERPMYDHWFAKSPYLERLSLSGCAPTGLLADPEAGAGPEAWITFRIITDQFFIRPRHETYDWLAYPPAESSALQAVVDDAMRSGRVLAMSGTYTLSPCARLRGPEMTEVEICRPAP